MSDRKAAVGDINESAVDPRAGSGTGEAGGPNVRLIVRLGVLGLVLSLLLILVLVDSPDAERRADGPKGVTVVEKAPGAIPAVPEPPSAEAPETPSPEAPSPEAQPPETSPAEAPPTDPLAPDGFRVPDLTTGATPAPDAEPATAPETPTTPPQTETAELPQDPVETAAPRPEIAPPVPHLNLEICSPF